MRDELSLEQKLEAMLTVALEPISRRGARRRGGRRRRDGRRDVALVASRSSKERRGFQVVELASGWVMQSSPEVAPWVTKFANRDVSHRLVLGRARVTRDHRLSPARLARPDHRAARRQRRRRGAAPRATRLHRRVRSSARSGTTHSLRHDGAVPRPNGTRHARRPAAH